MINLIAIIALIAALSSSCARSASGPPNQRADAQAVPHAQIHFPFDDDGVLTSEVPYLEANADWMKRNGDAVVILEGHCDEIGGKNYNMELGDRRARGVKAHLIEKGVKYDRVIMVVSFGEDQPLDPEHNRDAWRRNRRVEFRMR